MSEIHSTKNPDNKKRIGIITHYYDSTNYGGTLQAYALCKYLNDSGYDARQIAYKMCLKPFNLQQIENKKVKIKDRIISKLFNFFYGNEIKNREVAFKKFRSKYIIDTIIVYDKDSIKDTNKDFDFFITGSDQVWNLKWYDPNFFLEFADSSKKGSYAASLGMKSLSDNEKQYFRSALSDFKSISVREKESCALLRDCLSEDVSSVLDPTLLIDLETWDSIASARIEDDKYLFCYFLNDNTKCRELANEYAIKNKLKIVTIPYLQKKFIQSDFGFGDKVIFDADPSDFISLVKFASCVFTDSFHASVFASLYKTPLIVFSRVDNSDMDNRIHNLLELFNREESFCETDNKQNMGYIDGVLKKNNRYSDKKFKEEKSASEEFISKMLND